jgi:hypothetical protein
MKKLLFGSALFLATPLIALAQSTPVTVSTTGGQLTNVQNLVHSAGNIVSSLIPILIALALVVFFWGLVRYIWSGGEFKEQGRTIMIAGLVSLFVMVCVWGIVIFAAGALGVGVGGTAPAPGIPGYSGGSSNGYSGTCATPGSYGPGC